MLVVLAAGASGGALGRVLLLPVVLAAGEGEGIWAS